MNIKKILLTIAVIFGLSSFGNVANAKCGDITIANMNWASANFMAEVDKIILEEGLWMFSRIGAWCYDAYFYIYARKR